MQTTSDYGESDFEILFQKYKDLGIIPNNNKVSAKLEYHVEKDRVRISSPADAPHEEQLKKDDNDILEIIESHVS